MKCTVALLSTAALVTALPTFNFSTPTNTTIQGPAAPSSAVIPGSAYPSSAPLLDRPALLNTTANSTWFINNTSSTSPTSPSPSTSYYSRLRALRLQRLQSTKWSNSTTNLNGTWVQATSVSGAAQPSGVARASEVAQSSGGVRGVEDDKMKINGDNTMTWSGEREGPCILLRMVCRINWRMGAGARIEDQKSFKGDVVRKIACQCIILVIRVMNINLKAEARSTKSGSKYEHEELVIITANRRSRLFNDEELHLLLVRLTVVKNIANLKRYTPLGSLARSDVDSSVRVTQVIHHEYSSS
ncbi:hypothetical protein EJ08DRAFT_663113 [Tothia fuscella]|uniref:Uncharacterized protein n=1 Tax=Tothia fuscella TaxID=1048955 RepID=A0A9P4NLV4_9PEZI|nr:hypothetical protein EJ08DRAFT_663113 [Tothia fuscella]